MKLLAIVLVVGLFCMGCRTMIQTERTARQAQAVTYYRGVMSPVGKFSEDDLRTLKEWNVNIVRFQLNENWDNDRNRDLDYFDSWLEEQLGWLDDLLAKAPEYGLKVCIDLHAVPGGRISIEKGLAMLYDRKYADHFVKTWQKIAKRYKGNPAVYGYDLVNEPGEGTGMQEDVWTLLSRCAREIRKIDPDTPIVMEFAGWGCPDSFKNMRPLEMDNVIYEAHMYIPFEFTHQGIGGFPKGMVYPGYINGKIWSRDALAASLAPVREFQLKYNVPIFIGEFSAIVWANGAEVYLADCISIFEEYGWDWAFHSFREWNGWSLEHDGTGPGDLFPAPNTPRKQALLKGFEKNLEEISL